MIAVDTNILIRLLTQDEPEQAARATALFAAETIFIPVTVVLETEWVLRYAYEFQPAAISAALRKLFGLPNVSVENDTAVALALAWYESGLDFADALHLGLSLHCRHLKTFDRQFANRARAVESLPVQLL